ncbi:heme biosynthesis protein HemY [Zhongshania guokunii]|uniref:Heme biosynthesis protein HemY n=1 Tax=Zhongshania guokunii TaxID=641783 RepID=A0ABV3U4X4_9GAMM
MKIFIAVLLALALAAGLAAAIQQDSGYILIAYGQTTVEMTIWVGLAVLTVFLLLVMFIFASLRRGAKVGDSIGSFWSVRRAARGRSHTTLGMIAFIEGNWAKSRKLLTDSAKDTETPLINYLLAARASNQLGDASGSRHYLGLAEETSNKASIAVALTQAEMQVENGQLEEALATLTRARRNAERHPSVLTLLKKVYIGLRDWGSLLALIPDLRKHSGLSEERLAELEREALMGQLEHLAQQGDVTGLQQWWKHVPRSWHKDAGLLLAYSRVLVAAGDSSGAEKLLRQSLKLQWHSDLLKFYGLIAGSDVAKQLSAAEAWQKDHSDDPVLLLTLGRLSLRNELWGKAREYFEQAYQRSPNAEVCFELGRLMSNLDEPAAAERFTQEALQLQSQSLPSLPQPSLSNRSA